MARYVIDAGAALRLAQDGAVIRDEHRLLAPALLRSQVLTLLYEAVQRGELTTGEAKQRLSHVRGLPVRLLGDRVLQDAAWKVAAELGWPDTLAAEYVALTRLHADALVTLDERLAHDLTGVVEVAPLSVLS